MTTKPLKMESPSHKVPTYFVYEKSQQDGKFGEIIGPLFSEEIEDIKNDVFTNKPVQIDPESVFKAFHYDEYKKAFRDYWHDFVARCIDSLDLPVEYEIHSSQAMGIDEDPASYEDCIDKEWNAEKLLDEILNLNDVEDNEILQPENFSIISRCYTINKDIQGSNKLYISFSIDFSPYWVGVMVKELTLYLDGIFDLEMGEPFYIAQNGNIITGIEACYFERMKDVTRYQNN